MTRKWSWLPGWSSSMPGVPSVGGDPDAATHARPLRARLISLLVRPITPPLWLGLLVAMSLIVVETHHRLCTETTHRDRTERAVV
jgi:hypothetical protein